MLLSSLFLQDGSPYYMIALNMKKMFEEKYSKSIKDEGETCQDEQELEVRGAAEERQRRQMGQAGS